MQQGIAFTLLCLWDSMGIPFLTQTDSEFQSDLETLDRVLGKQK